MPTVGMERWLTDLSLISRTHITNKQKIQQPKPNQPNTEALERQTGGRWMDPWGSLARSLVNQ